MATRYCYTCSVELGIGGNALTGDFSGSSYQLGKFVKHTVPFSSANLTGIFADPSFAAYENYIVSSSASGSVEVDDSGRTNMIWYAGRTIGASWKNGRAVLPNDAVKLVLSHDSTKVHPYSVSSAPYSGETCSRCGKPVLT